MSINYKEIEHYKEVIFKAAGNDLYHRDCPELQLDTLSLIVDGLLKDNKDGKNEQLIGFFAHLGKSLNELIKYRKLMKQRNEKY